MRIAQVHVFGELHIKKAGVPRCIKFFYCHFWNQH